LYLCIYIALLAVQINQNQSVLPLTRLGGTDAVVLQNNCVRRTCSRSLHSTCLGRGYSVHKILSRDRCGKCMSYFLTWRGLGSLVSF